MDIVEVLTRTLTLVESSADSDWSHTSAADVAEELRRAITALESGKGLDRRGLALLFAPTGPIQETSFDNGWGDEGLVLAAAVDGYLAQGKKPRAR
jgi:hypothetical protein